MSTLSPYRRVLREIRREADCVAADRVAGASARVVLAGSRDEADRIRRNLRWPNDGRTLLLSVAGKLDLAMAGRRFDNRAIFDSAETERALRRMFPHAFSTRTS